MFGISLTLICCKIWERIILQTMHRLDAHSMLVFLATWIQTDVLSNLRVKFYGGWLILLTHGGVTRWFIEVLTVDAMVQKDMNGEIHNNIWGDKKKENYLKEIKGDTIAIQGLAVRFHFSIHRISSENVPMLVTFSGNAFNDVYLGLVLQHHYVALERIF